MLCLRVCVVQLKSSDMGSCWRGNGVALISGEWWQNFIWHGFVSLQSMQVAELRVYRLRRHHVRSVKVGYACIVSGAVFLRWICRCRDIPSSQASALIRLNVLKWLVNSR